VLGETVARSRAVLPDMSLTVREDATSEARAYIVTALRAPASRGTAIV
jgi:hypothetical protein